MRTVSVNAYLVDGNSTSFSDYAAYDNYPRETEGTNAYTALMAKRDIKRGGPGWDPGSYNSDTVTYHSVLFAIIRFDEEADEIVDATCGGA